MTQHSGQSGQGEGPHAPQQPRQAHEGVVLPADGSEPLLPGTYGDQAGPAGASPWGQPWGPESQQAQNAGPMPSYEWSGQPQQPGAAPLPPDVGALPAHEQGFPAQTPPAQQIPGQQIPAQQMPGQYAPQDPYGAQGLPPQQDPYGQPAGALPPQQGELARQDPFGQQSHQNQQNQQSGHGAQDPQQGFAPQGQPGQLPPLQGELARQDPFAPQAQPGQPGQGGPGHALPDAVPGGAAYDGDATQYIAPVPGGRPQAAPLPPEQPAADATQFLGRAARRPMPDAVPGGMPQGSSDSEATQYIPPVPADGQDQGYGVRPGGPDDRQPPAEFDALFRTEAESPAAATQQMPRFDPHSQRPGRAEHEGAFQPEPVRRKEARTGSKVPLIAAIGVGLLVVGIGAGALLGGGGSSDDEAKGDKTKTVSDSSSASPEPSPTVDPAREQAVALDKLLADSNNSRDSVVRAVANIGACKALPQSSKDLRAAAGQRNGLVTRLNGLAVDKLPNNAALKSALTDAWKASASADTHYAAWGDQARGKNVCKKGHARTTPQRQAGDRASVSASRQKAEAAKLWNAIATKYGLTQRSAVQL